ncbi:TetR/AcrR family transcriptional regulator [Mycobacterium sp. M23085]|uniref:TetR/AcrR family transcriptional regulator n=1 Tax=Mycobacterium sp. M23085 TaxID=3378087 RepID=UPI0038779B08
MTKTSPPPERTVGRRRGASSVRRDDVLAAARDMLDDEGWDRLNMVALAERLGIKGPSLYNHVDNLDDLRRQLWILVVREMSEAIRDAVLGLAGDDAVRAIATTYREYANRYPRRYALPVSIAGLHGRDIAQAVSVSTDTSRAVFRYYGLTGDNVDIATTLLTASMSGFMAMELRGAMQVDPDTAYDVLIENFIAGLHGMK